MNRIIYLVLYICICLLIALYFNSRGSDLYLPIYKEYLNDGYTESFFHDYYERYCSAYTYNDKTQWFNNALIFIDAGVCAKFNFPFYGHYYLSYVEYPGGYSGCGSLSHELFGSLTHELFGCIGKDFEKLHHIVTFQGCPVYELHGVPFVQMPLEHAYSFFRYFNISCVGMFGKYLVMEHEVIPTQLHFSTLLWVWFDNYYVYIIIVVTFSLFILYYYKLINLNIFINSIIGVMGVIGILCLYLFIFKSHPPCVGEMYGCSPTSLYSADGIFNKYTMRSTFMPVNILGNIDECIDLLCNGKSIHSLKYSLYGHHYLIHHDSNYHGVLDDLYFKKFKYLTHVDRLVTFEGCPLYEQWGRVYVQIPLAKAHAMSLTYTDIYGRGLYRLCKYYLLYYLGLN